MDIDKLYDLVEDFFGYKCNMIGINSEKKEVSCILYDSFFLECNINDQLWKIWGGNMLWRTEIYDYEFSGKKMLFKQ